MITILCKYGTLLFDNLLQAYPPKVRLVNAVLIKEYFPIFSRVCDNDLINSSKSILVVLLNIILEMVIYIFRCPEKFTAVNAVW